LNEANLFTEPSVAAVIVSLCTVIATLFWVVIKCYEARIVDKDKCIERYDRFNERLESTLDRQVAANDAVIDYIKQRHP